jgi:hypothetical protein
MTGVVFAGAAAAAAAGPAGVVGSAWAADGAAAPAFSATGPATHDSLLGVSCVSGSFCMAVGDTSAEAWNGSTWRAVKAPPTGTDQALSCATASFCVAVPGTTVSNVAEQWNGRAWHLMNMSGDSCTLFFCGLYGISCPHAQQCMAVGTDTNHAGNVVLGTALQWHSSTCRQLSPAAGQVHPRLVRRLLLAQASLHGSRLLLDHAHLPHRQCAHTGGAVERHDLAGSEHPQPPMIRPAACLG